MSAPAPAPSLVNDELWAVVSALCTRYPARTRSEIQRVVTDVYRQLAANATITAHLIPLTLNRSRRVLDAMPASEPGEAGSAPVVGEGLLASQK